MTSTPEGERRSVGKCPTCGHPYGLSKIAKDVVLAGIDRIADIRTAIREKVPNATDAKIANALAKLKQRGKISRPAYGLYARPTNRSHP